MPSMRRRAAVAAVVRAARNALAASGRSADAQERALEEALNTVVGSDRLLADFGRGELTTIEHATTKVLSTK